MTDLVRLSVNMTPETAEALKELAARKQVSYTEAVRWAIAIAKFVSDEIDAGRVVRIVDEKRKETRQLFLVWKDDE